MKEYNFEVSFKDGGIYSKERLNELVQNDYNSIKLNFEFKDLYSNKILFKMIDSSENLLVSRFLEDNSIILEAGELKTTGTYKFDLSLYDEDSKLTTSDTFILEVRKEIANINDEKDNPEKPTILDQLINEVSFLEEKVETNESTRVENENTRIQAETSRNQAESERVNKETSRISNESERLKNEAIRVSQEEKRVSSEEIRKSKEETRIKNENDRIKQEEEREQYFTDIKEKVDNGEFNGECNFATFDIENGYLVMNKTKDNMLLDFQLNGNDLEVVING